MLLGECKFGIFEEAVHEDDEFAQAGHQRHLRFLARRPQLQIKRFEDGVVFDRAQRGHVERATHHAAPAGDVPHPRFISAVLVVGGHARQGSDRLVAQGAQLGQVGQHDRRRDEPDARDGVESVRLGLEFFHQRR